MGRRTIAIATGAGAIAALGAHGPAAWAGVPAARPNVVVLQTDDQTAASMRVMTHTNELLAARGAAFTRSFASFPLCCPSRATLFTGQYAHNHGVVHNRPPFGGYVKLDKTNWLPVWLRNAGYRTIQIGRTLNGYGLDNPNRTEVPPGWDEWYVPLDPSTFDYFDFTLNENGRLHRYGAPDGPREHQTDVYNRKAVEVIGRVAPSAQPFFLYVAWSAPHSGRPRGPDDPAGMSTPEPAARHRDRFAAEPLPQPPNFNEADVFDKPHAIAYLPLLGHERIAAIRENYQQELESLLAVDEGVRQVHDALGRAGELDNTVIVFTSDNGFFHGEHRLPSQKGLPYEPSVRIPLVVRGPGVPPGVRLSQLVSNVDVAPTILEAAGARPGRVQDGVSLFALMRDPGRELGRDMLFENGRGANAVSRYRAIRTYRYVYIEHPATEEYELYDLRRDPFELRSLDYDPRHDAVRIELARRLRRLQRCRGRACRLAPDLRVRARTLAGRRPPPRRRQLSARSCPRRTVRVAVGGRDRALVTRADFFLGRRRVSSDRRRPFVSTLEPRRIRAGRRTRLRVRATLRDGRALTVDRRLRLCR